MRYPNLESQSAILYERARRVIADGSSRTTVRVDPYSIYIRSARGKYLTDVDGNQFFDFNNNYTSMIHGHSHPAIIEAVSKQIEIGTGFSFGSEVELKLGELLCNRSSTFDKIRFMNSGTEAVMNAIKAARAYTGRSKIAKCENSYHGSYDYAEVSLGVDPTDLSKGNPIAKPYSDGTPSGVLEDVVVIPFNQIEMARNILKKNGDDIAGILIDPIGQGMSRFPATDDFLSMIENFCTANGSLFIADEVISYRAGYSGCQGVRNIHPDLTVLGKIIGGGFPVGAVAGKSEIMEVFETNQGRAKLPHGGTYNANPVTMAAGLAAMEMMTENEFCRLNKLCDSFKEGIKEVFSLTDTDGEVEGQYSIFAIKTSEDYLVDEPQRGHVYKSRGLHRYLVKNGYWMTPGLLGVCSTVMDESDIDPFCQVLMDGIETLRKGSK